MAGDYLSILVFKLIHVSKRGPWSLCCTDRHLNSIKTCRLPIISNAKCRNNVAQSSTCARKTQTVQNIPREILLNLFMASSLYAN